MLGLCNSPKRLLSMLLSIKGAICENFEVPPKNTGGRILAEEPSAAFTILSAVVILNVALATVSSVSTRARGPTASSPA